MGNQNTRVFTAIIEEVEGFNAFFEEMLSLWKDGRLVLPEGSWVLGWFEDLLGYVLNSVLEETESGHMEVEEIKRLDEVLTDLYFLVDESDMDFIQGTKETILAKIGDIQKTIVRSGFQSKVKQMKQRIEQARSAAKKEADAKKLGDDKV